VAPLLIELFSDHLLLFVILDAVPQAHAARAEQAGEQHQDGRGGDVRRGAPPAARHAGPEGDEHRDEGHDEERDHGAAHVQARQRVVRHLPRPALRLGHEVLDVVAVRLHGAKVRLHGRRALPGVAYPEQTLGPRVVVVFVVDVVQQILDAMVTGAPPSNQLLQQQIAHENGCITDLDLAESNGRLRFTEYVKSREPIMRPRRRELCEVRTRTIFAQVRVSYKAGRATCRGTARARVIL